ncbi:DUF6415 family natural product biosynthesis protein [Streptomyces sp. DG2A-72]|uniref:DUF6415 family natural product biosynthesis protein n=1 Tax=Streptomyces sp. DG2A-72 TaxID=3051386 RepID=UPI00265C3CE1|nr:DUF6415 family natural product biosynthesis protein [Streptomyces sp. DG2A-72]MDO0933935.1 DUF6415 family natural product biosynthesis protein [Streptomyces sp. DG2A-72]
MVKTSDSHGTDVKDPPVLDLRTMRTYISTLRVHLQLAIPEVEAAAVRRDRDDIPRHCALACIGEARRKLGIEARPGLSGGIAYARRLGRSLNALLDHYETFNS